MTRFIFVRHGQTDWNRENRFRGRLDIPLNATGLEQARCVARALANTPLAAIYASPVSRTMVTAQTIADAHGMTVVPRPELYDLDYGTWQGKTPDEIDPTAYAQWLAQPSAVQFPGGESLADVRARVMRLVQELCVKHANSDAAAVVLASHDLVGKVLVCALLDAGLDSIHRVQQDNACIDRFEADAGNYLLVSVNETGHLG